MAKRTGTVRNDKSDDFYILKEQEYAPGWTQYLTDGVILHKVLGKVMSCNSHPGFKIPKPFRAWCHVCNTGFMSIDELQSHNKRCSREAF